MKKVIITLSLVMASLGIINAQTVVVEEEVNKAPTDQMPAFTPSKTDAGFMMELTSYGGFDEKGLKGKFGNSIGINILFNLKYRLANKIQLVSQVGINFENYSFTKIDTNTPFPTTVSNNEMDRFSVTAASLSLGARFKLKKSLYTELGAMGKWNFSKVYNYETKNENGNKTEVFVHDLAYIKDITADAYVRLGVKGISLVAYYRLTDMLQTAGYAPIVYETPRLRLGITLGL
jgi:hypothetical protein